MDIGRRICPFQATTEWTGAEQEKLALVGIGGLCRLSIFCLLGSDHGIKSTWRFMLIKLGIQDLHFHDLRHEAISRLFELGTLDMMEIAAISGHKSLSMLKRYTHLKANRLVSKLEGNKHKGRQHILDHLIPYPAVVEQENDRVQIRILDFDHLVVDGQSEESAIRAAQDHLLRRIMRLIKDSMAIPPPDQYLDQVDERSLVMIDPLAVEAIAMAMVR